MKIKIDQTVSCTNMWETFEGNQRRSEAEGRTDDGALLNEEQRIHEVNCLHADKYIAHLGVTEPWKLVCLWKIKGLRHLTVDLLSASILKSFNIQDSGLCVFL